MKGFAADSRLLVTFDSARPNDQETTCSPLLVASTLAIKQNV